ncbi:hypothetical protein [Embleya sp. NPDC005971]|uniref:hypothetical protein n=1 Tax=Embleya sp. NPDC005971 TaxID=3156724 RepID=UPI00340561C7
MGARDTTPTPTFDDIHTRHPTVDHEHEITRDLAPLRTNNLLWALRVTLPDVHYTLTPPGRVGTTVRVHDGAASWATLTTTSDDDHNLVREGGPRRLADELLAAWDRWIDDGRIRLYDYGMTVTPTDQYVWAGDPDTGRRWPIPDPTRTWCPAGPDERSCPNTRTEAFVGSRRCHFRRRAFSAYVSNRHAAAWWWPAALLATALALTARYRFRAAGDGPNPPEEGGGFAHARANTAMS